jgi:hypothetical protein
MKIKFTNSKPLPIGMGLSRGILRSVLLLFVIFTCLNAFAQSNPASNIQGPLKAKVNGGHIFITNEVAAGINPAISFYLVNNSSGAVIVSQGTYVHNNAKGTGKQIVEIDPGTTAGSFTIVSETSNKDGKASSSMSVTVTK